jgi:hypothetical protein
MVSGKGGKEGGATLRNDPRVLARATGDEAATTSPVPCLMQELLAVHERHSDLRAIDR